MSKEFLKKKRVYLNLFFCFCIEGNILKELVLKMMNLKNICGKPIVGIIFNSAKLFNIRKIKKIPFDSNSFWRRSCIEEGLKTCLGKRFFFEDD